MRWNYCLTHQRERFHFKNNSLHFFGLGTYVHTQSLLNLFSCSNQLKIPYSANIAGIPLGWKLSLFSCLIGMEQHNAPATLPQWKDTVSWAHNQLQEFARFCCTVNNNQTHHASFLKHLAGDLQHQCLITLTDLTKTAPYSTSKEAIIIPWLWLHQ